MHYRLVVLSLLLPFNLTVLSCKTGSPQNSTGVASAPSPRRHSHLVFHPGLGELVLAGGGAARTSRNPTVFFDDVWAWNGTRWLLLADHTGFPQGTGSLIYDAKNERLLLHGGFWSETGDIRGKHEVFGQLREFKDRKWVVIDEGASQKMTGPAAFFDESSTAVVVFGRSLQGDAATWSFDRTGWTRINGGPAELIGCGFAYDNDREALVLVGGFSERNGPSHATWELSEGNWKMVTPIGPPPRDAPVMAYDQKNKLTLAFGGVNDSGTLRDTWGWNGADWLLLNEQGPGPFDMPTMGYDEKRGVTVLVGTPLAGGAMQVWEWTDNVWKQVVI